MWSRAIAGIIAGFLLAAAATGLLAWLPPGPRNPSVSTARLRSASDVAPEASPRHAASAA